MWHAAASLLSFEACVLEDIFWRLLLPIVLSDDEAFHLVNKAAHVYTLRHTTRDM